MNYLKKISYVIFSVFLIKIYLISLIFLSCIVNFDDYLKPAFQEFARSITISNRNFKHLDFDQISYLG